jgi:hypothetical protein
MTGYPPRPPMPGMPMPQQRPPMPGQTQGGPQMPPPAPPLQGMPARPAPAGAPLPGQPMPPHPNMSPMPGPDLVSTPNPAAAAPQLLPPQPPGKLHDVVIRRSKKCGLVKIENIPPEELLIPPLAGRDIQRCNGIGRKYRRSISELLEMGYDEDDLEKLPSGDGEDWGGERTERFANTESDTSPHQEDSLDPAAREVWLVELWVRVDYDGDGIAELRRVVKSAGPGGPLLENEEAEEIPIQVGSPIAAPHKLVGLSVADLAMELQLVSSTVLRQTLDNMYRTNNGRVVLSSKVDIGDFLDQRPGGAVRMIDESLPEGHVVPLVTPSILQDALPLLERVDQLAEKRTGVTAYNQGMDADSLNKTASGMSMIMQKSNAREELIAREFAEGLVKDIFKQILRLIVRHQDKARTIRLRGKWVAIDPRDWNDEMDLTVTVGLGTGNKDQNLVHLNNVLQIQQAILMALGPQNPLCDLKNVYATCSKIVENAGLKNPEHYFSDPTNAPPLQPPPNPEMLKAQASIQALQMKAQIEQQAAQSKLQADQQRAALDAELERNKATLAQQLEMGQMEHDRQTEIARLQAETEISRQQAENDMALARMKMTAEIEIMRAKAAAAADIAEKELAAKKEAGAFKPKAPSDAR